MPETDASEPQSNFLADGLLLLLAVLIMAGWLVLKGLEILLWVGFVICGLFLIAYGFWNTDAVPMMIGLALLLVCWRILALWRKVRASGR